MVQKICTMLSTSISLLLSMAIVCLSILPMIFSFQQHLLPISSSSGPFGTSRHGYQDNRYQRHILLHNERDNSCKEAFGQKRHGFSTCAIATVANGTRQRFKGVRPLRQSAGDEIVDASSSSSTSAVNVEEIKKEDAALELPKKAKKEEDNGGSDSKMNDDFGTDENCTDDQRQEKSIQSYSARYIDDNGLYITTDSEGRLTARPVALRGGSKDESSDNDLVLESKPDSKALTEPDVTNTYENAEADTTIDNQENADVLDADTDISSSKNMKHKNEAKVEVNRAIKKIKKTVLKEEVPKPLPVTAFNVVLTHCTADFDSLASAVGLAKLWSNEHTSTSGASNTEDSEFESSQTLPTFVVLPRGAHPAVQRFLALHKHLFPIRSLRSLPSDLSNLDRVGLVDAQRRDRIGPAEHLLSYAKRVTVVDHHIDGDSDIPEATDYVVEKVGSVSTMVAERLQKAGLELTEAEATLLALGIHADTGSLCFDSTTTRDALALAFVMGQGASQTAIAEHAKASLSREQQGVLTQALINTNSTLVHGVTVSTVLLR